MSPLNPQSTLVPNTQSAIDHSQPDHPNAQDRRISIIQTSPRRSSSQSIRQALMSRSRANSMASIRRLSRAGSRQSGTALGQDGQFVASGPTDFDAFFDPNQFDFDAFVNDVDFDGIFGNVGPADYFPSFPVQQYGQASVDATIDPVLLNQQPPAQQTWDFTDSTPGLTAIPGAADLFPTQHMQPVQSNYPIEPTMAPIMPHGKDQPYFTQGREQTGFTPIEQATQDVPVPAPSSKKRTRSESDSDSDSEDDVPPVKRDRSAGTPQIEHLSGDESDSYKTDSVKSSRARKHARGRRESRESGTSSSSSSLGKLKKPVIAHTGQKPLKSDDKPWIRINGNTKGETTRTARINNEAQQERKYKVKPLPHANNSWTTASGKYTFEYSHHSGMDEFKKKKMSARQIMAYIMEYPTDDLRLWIQISPADTARRYASPAHSKCLFENCPKHVCGDSGTIDVGHYRVAFDEKYKAYGNHTVDPFDCAGYVHLYCLERFCDFERICRKTDVQVDKRVDLPREIGQAKWTMSGRPETEQAQYFIKACKKDKLRSTEAFAQYPVHTSSSAPKQHDRTLTYAIADINIASRTRSQVRQFVARKMTPNVLMINKGDVEIAMTQKKIKNSEVFKRAVKKGKATAANFNYEALYDAYDPIINERIHGYLELKDKLLNEDAVGTAPRRTKSGGSKRKASHETIDIHSDDDAAHRPIRGGTRSSPRKRQRINYDEDDAPRPQPQTYQHPYIAQGYMPAPSIRRPSLPPSIRKPSPSNPPLAQPTPADARKASASYLFPDTGPSLSAFPSPVDDGPGLTTEEVDALIKKYALERRKSSTLSNGPHRSPRRTGRVASFAAQPVSKEMEFDVDDPPSRLVATPTLSLAAAARRSERLASRGQ